MLISFVRRLASLGLYGFAGSLPKYLAYAALEALCFFCIVHRSAKYNYFVSQEY